MKLALISIDGHVIGAVEGERSDLQSFFMGTVPKDAIWKICDESVDIGWTFDGVKFVAPVDSGTKKTKADFLAQIDALRNTAEQVMP